MEWLRKRADRKGWGEKTSAARKAGLSTSYVNRLLNAKRPGNMKLDTLERVAKDLGYEPWEVLYMAEHGMDRMPPPSPTQRPS